MAARIGHKFGIDPVAVLRDGGDSFVNEVRLAALAVVYADEEAEAKAATK